MSKAHQPPIPEANQPGHHPDRDQDKPIDAFVERARAKVHETETAPARERAAGIDSFLQEKKGARAHSRTRAGIPIEAVIPALAFVDAALKPSAAWNEVGANKAAWLAGIALMPGLGAWRYASDLKPRLNAAARALVLTGA